MDQEIVYKATIEYAREQGIEQGLAQGRVEERKEIILKLLKQGVDTKTISKATGLSTAEIDALNKNL